MNVPPELLPIIMTSVAGLAICRIGSVFASILAIRLARNDKELAALLELRRIEHRLFIPRRKQSIARKKANQDHTE